MAQLKTECTFYLVIESTAYLMMIKFAADETTSPLWLKLARGKEGGPVLVVGWILLSG